MLELREYTRKELLQIYNTTTRIDAIKNKIKRQGYTFTETGRGNNYKMLITALPTTKKRFSQYCIDNLSFSPQTDFNILKSFLYNLFTNKSFVELQFNEMQKVLQQQGINTKADTLSKYFHHLIEKDIIFLFDDEYIYYVFDCRTGENKYIDQEEYRTMYAAFWNTALNENDFDKAENELLLKYGSRPKKRKRPVLNGIFKQHYDAIISLIEQEI